MFTFTIRNANSYQAIFNGGIDKEFEKLEDEISAKFLEYIKLYSKL
ncbi:hypothetical protein [Ruminococcus bromii]|jgi:hypothetical protein|nr:hypothetical protein [Ruminococcus bromii]